MKPPIHVPSPAKLQSSLGRREGWQQLPEAWTAAKTGIHGRKRRERLTPPHGSQTCWERGRAGAGNNRRGLWGAPRRESHGAFSQASQTPAVSLRHLPASRRNWLSVSASRCWLRLLETRGPFFPFSRSNCTLTYRHCCEAPSQPSRQNTTTKTTIARYFQATAQRLSGLGRTSEVPLPSFDELCYRPFLVSFLHFLSSLCPQPFPKKPRVTHRVL